MKRNKKINEITYRTWENNWCYGQPGYEPPIEHTIEGKITSKLPDAMGYYIIKPKNNPPIKVHWTNIYPYF